MAKKTKNKGTKKSTSKKKGQASKPSLWFRAFKLMAILGIWGFLGLLGVIAYYCHDLPSIAKAAEFDRKRSVTVYANDNQTVLARYGELLGENLTYEEFPEHLIYTVLATEDRRFFYHFGIDPIGIIRAMMTNMQKNRIAQGGSTITQQLAKNMFLSSDRTIKRKVQEAVLALWLEGKLTKKEILAAYLNRVYMGAGAYGADAAAQIYFKKSAKDLTLEESAILAGLLKAPSRYNPRANPHETRERMQLVLSLVEEHFPEIVEKSNHSNQAKNTVTPARKPINITYKFDEARYFTDWIIDRLPIYVDGPNLDLNVYTTLELDKQKEAYSHALKHTQQLHKDRPKSFAKAPEFSAIFADKNGAVEVLLGGSDYSETQFNRATQAKRQPGSSFKPIIYLAALYNGWHMNDYISDDEFEKNGYSPQNYNDEYHGEVPLWEALINSYNIASVRLLDEIGIAQALNMAQNLGIKSKIQPDLSIALGTSETTLLEITQAYHKIAQHRSETNPSLYGINRITLKNGEMLYDREIEGDIQSSKKSLSTNYKETYQTEQIIAMMQGVVMHGTGRRANLGFPIAGKTGTSQNNRDALFIGFSSDYTGGVWIGYDDNQSMPDVYGGTTPASIWADIMRTLHKNSSPVPLLQQEHEFEYKNRFQFFSRSNSGNYGIRRYSSPNSQTNHQNDDYMIRNAPYQGSQEPRQIERSLGNNRDSL